MSNTPITRAAIVFLLGGCKVPLNLIAIYIEQENMLATKVKLFYKYSRVRF